MSVYDVIVIGAGIAGLTATTRLLNEKRSLKVVNIEAETFGGLVLNVNELDGNVRGSGMDLAGRLMMEATELGAEAFSERVIRLSEEADCWAVTTIENNRQARAVIIASGASIKKLDVSGEEEFKHNGISHCADCDGPLYSGKDVVVVGGGDSAIQEAKVLSQFCRHVVILNRGDQFTAKPYLIDALNNCTNVQARHKTELKAISGGQSIDKVQVLDLAANVVSEIACNAVFGFIGLKPSSDFVPEIFTRDAEGRLKTDGSLRIAKTLFAVGAVRSGHGGMLEHAITEGQLAADEVIKSLAQ